MYIAICSEWKQGKPVFSTEAAAAAAAAATTTTTTTTTTTKRQLLIAIGFVLHVFYRKEHDLAFLLPWPTSFMIPRTIARYRDGNSPLLVLALSQWILHSISHFINTHFNTHLHAYIFKSRFHVSRTLLYIHIFHIPTYATCHSYLILHFIAQITFAVDIQIYSYLNHSPFFRAFSSAVRQMPGYTSQRWGTVLTLPN